MAGLVPAIYAAMVSTWMPATSAGMTAAESFAPPSPVMAGLVPAIYVDGRLPRQHRRAHQRLVDGSRALAALADRPDDQRLAAAHVAAGEDLGL